MSTDSESMDLSAWLQDVSGADDLEQYKSNLVTKDTEVLYFWNEAIWSIRVLNPNPA